MARICTLNLSTLARPPFLPPRYSMGGFFLPLRAVGAGQEAVTRWAVMYLLFQTLTRLFDLTFQGLKV
nr:MAG TPA: hypothetical protein [Siphoviridae sp. ctX8T1]